MVNDKVQKKFYVRESLARLVNADERTNSEVVNTALLEYYGGEKTSFIETRKDMKIDRAESLEEEGETILRQARQLRNEAEAMEDRIDKVESDEEIYRKKLDSLLDLAEDGAILSSDHPKVSDLALERDMDVSDVLSDLKSRAKERDTYLEGGVEL